MVGLLINLWQSSIWMQPFPSQFLENQSAIFRAGSPKNCSPPSPSSATTERIMAAKLAEDMLPYCMLYSLAFSLTYCSMARRSLVSIKSSPSSSAILKMMDKISDWVSFRSKIRLSSRGPISETVVLKGMPFSPYTSQKLTGYF